MQRQKRKENTSEQCLVYGCFHTSWQFYPWTWSRKHRRWHTVFCNSGGMCPFWIATPTDNKTLSSCVSDSTSRVLVSCVRLRVHTLVMDQSFFFFYLFNIFMRAAKGPFHAPIWEQPLPLGAEPMTVSRLSHVVAGVRGGLIHHGKFGGGDTCGSECPGASGWSVQFNICMRAAVCVCVLETGDNVNAEKEGERQSMMGTLSTTFLLYNVDPCCVVQRNSHTDVTTKHTECVCLITGLTSPRLTSCLFYK